MENNKLNKFLSPKRIFFIPKSDTKNICVTGLLIASTVVLSAISGYLRIGNIGKLSLGFVSVFLSAYCYGGIIGGMVGVTADIISFLVNPAGAFLPFLTAVEFLFGFFYGFIFFGLGENRRAIKSVICVLFQTLINLLLKTLILSSAFGPNFKTVFFARLPICTVQAILILTVLIPLVPFAEKLSAGKK